MFYSLLISHLINADQSETSTCDHAIYVLYIDVNCQYNGLEVLEREGGVFLKTFKQFLFQFWM